MLISKRPPIVFFAVPKTASVSIETAFAPHFDMVMSKHPSLKHMNVRIYEASLANFVTRRVAKSPVRIAVMREPFDWILSWYRYRARPENDGAENSSKGVSADEFIRSYISDDPAPWAQVGSQYTFVTNKHDELGVDRLYRFDDLPRLAGFLNKRLGQNVSLGRINISPQIGDDVSEETKRAYRDFASKDFDLFESLG